MSPPGKARGRANPSDMRTYLPECTRHTHHAIRRIVPRRSHQHQSGPAGSAAWLFRGSTAVARRRHHRGAAVASCRRRRSMAKLRSHGATTAWLLIEGHVDVAKMRQLDRYITARGDVYQRSGHRLLRRWRDGHATRSSDRCHLRGSASCFAPGINGSRSWSYTSATEAERRYRPLIVSGGWSCFIRTRWR